MYSATHTFKTSQQGFVNFLLAMCLGSSSCLSQLFSALTHPESIVSWGSAKAAQLFPSFPSNEVYDKEGRVSSSSWNLYME